jgi:phosphatidylcholine synthase
MTLLAWLVHLYTASSAALGLWAVVACFDGRLQLAALLMLLTMAIDSSDGALARLVRVRERIPWFDGARLDDLCDYFTYVIVPACFMLTTGVLPHPLWAAVPVLASAYGFSRDDAKTTDHFFTGWPSYWNVVAIYLWLFALPPAAAAGLIAGFAIAVFVPLHYLYPSRTRPLRPLSVSVLGAWTAGFAWLVTRPAPDPVHVLWSLLGPAYYLGVSFVLDWQRRSARLRA